MVNLLFWKCCVFLHSWNFIFWLKNSTCLLCLLGIQDIILLLYYYYYYYYYWVRYWAHFLKMYTYLSAFKLFSSLLGGGTLLICLETYSTWNLLGCLNLRFGFFQLCKLLAIRSSNIFPPSFSYLPASMTSIFWIFYSIFSAHLHFFDILNTFAFVLCFIILQSVAFAHVSQFLFMCFDDWLVPHLFLLWYLVVFLF